MRKIGVAIIGAGPYGLSLAAHLASHGVEHRVFGRPMQFWSDIADAGEGRYLKSFCFGTNLSSPKPGFSFADYNRPRGLETFEPCSMANFTDYGRWFQQYNVPDVKPVDVTYVGPHPHGFTVELADGERIVAAHVVVATGLSRFAHVPREFAMLPADLVTHTANIRAFSPFRGRTVAVIGAGQSALEAATLLHEAGSMPNLLVRENKILWHGRASRNPSLWERLRSPVSGLGAGPKAWALTNFPGAMHHAPARWRTRFVKRHLPAEGAWWLRERFEHAVPVQLGVTVIEAREQSGRVLLQLRDGNDGRVRQLTVDHVVAGCGFMIDVDGLEFLDLKLRDSVQRIENSPLLNSHFESSIPGLSFIGPASAMSFGPLFRFVVGAAYTARVVSHQLASQFRTPSLKPLPKLLPSHD